MQNSSMTVVSQILNQLKPKLILDAPCGAGWLSQSISFSAIIDGIDLYESPSGGVYRNIFLNNLNHGIPEKADTYDAIVCCEGIEHLGNPLLFFESAKKHLKKNGILLVTTPNTWHPASKLQFFLRGFFPSFPCLVGKIKEGTHMHIMPWSFPHLYLYLKLAGFTDIELHSQPLSKPKRFFERICGLPQQVYCWLHSKKAKRKENRIFWSMASSSESALGRHLIVTAKVNPQSNSL